MEQCKYKLPCGWCDRKNEKCEMLKKSIAQIPEFSNSTTHNHIWIIKYITTSGITYYCSKCGAIKHER